MKPTSIRAKCASNTRPRSAASTSASASASGTPTGHHVIGQPMHGRALPHVDGCRDEDRAGPGKFDPTTHDGHEAHRDDVVPARLQPGRLDVQGQQFEVVHVGCRVGKRHREVRRERALTAYLEPPAGGPARGATEPRHQIGLT